MQMINMLFLNIAEMSLKAGIVILVVLAVRTLIRGLPKKFAYILWIVVAFRLIVPVSADSDISIFNLLAGGSVHDETSVSKGIEKRYTAGSADLVNENMDDDANKQAEQRYGQNNAFSIERIASSDSESFAHYVSAFAEEEPDIVNAVQEKMSNSSLISAMTIGWGVGMLMLVLYTVIAYVRIRRRIRYSIRLYDNVYACDKIRSPFVLGICSPRIYLPFRLNEVEQQCILSHERYHIRRRDNVIKSIAYILVVVYWFQPLVWVAYRLMCTDMEMSCDEKIISEFTIDMRKEYSRLLLAFALNKRQISASPLAFGEENTMIRVKNIMRYKKASWWKLAGGAAVIALTMAACGTNASTDEAIDNAKNVANIDDSTANAINVTDVTVHHLEERDTNGHHQEEQIHHTTEHQQAQWAENSMCDLELCSLDYADSDKIVFHISSGLFQYDLRDQSITRSIDLKALKCQEVQTGGECRITVYQNSDSHLRALIAPYPYDGEDSYVYDLEKDELFAYDEALLDSYTLFEGLVSKYDLPEEERLEGWKHAEYILPLEDHSYGVLRWGTAELGTMYYEAGGQKWELFHREQATLPKLLKQDDSFYQSFAMISGRNIQQCLLDYMAFYNMHDYAGICALSTGLEYSDEMQREFMESSDLLSLAEEVSHSDDEMEYLYQFSCGDDYGAAGPKVYVNFKYLEGEGWRAEGIPDDRE